MDVFTPRKRHTKIRVRDFHSLLEQNWQLVTKGNHKLALVSNEQGQISIFFSASLIVLISIIAFVINIGLFVKAKINLQNATDAAAYSGAAVQARQLSKIAYLNWEMRNIYKEWMYKYYVVGNLNINDVENPPSGEAMSFRLEEDRNVLTGEIAKDPYNFPAVCIHLAGSKTNICKRYAIPGLPEFGGYNMPGPEEASRTFIDSLIKTKVDDCLDRTRFNMLVNTTWAFNVLANDMDSTLAGQGPAILSDRQGAWPQAVELAMRIRNLEYAMNKPPVTEGVCKTTSETGNIKCGLNIGDLTSGKELGSERTVKAFYSAYRNIGNNIDNEMKETFTLTEIPPKKAILGNGTSASYLLVPEAKVQNYQKQYVDLKLMMVNYATFYAAMIPRAEEDTSGACDVSKVAIPVPGYPLGFYKNNDLLTYYAVRGEAEFFGMFNPFNSEPIKLTAYAAAKPMGGRIGPMLFFQKDGNEYFTGRTDASKYRSVPYIFSVDVGASPKKGTNQQLGNDNYAPGAPLPINFNADPGYFWLKNDESPLGGKITSNEVQFGVPNLVYDYTSGFSPDSYTDNGKKIFINTPTVDEGSDKMVGLFNGDQFKKFKGDLGANVTVEDLKRNIARVRAPTQYEAANYLIPTPQDQISDHDSFSPLASQSSATDLGGGVMGHTASIYAPLHGGENGQADVLWDSSNEVVSTIFEFMRVQKSGIDKYRASLNQAGKAVWNMKNNVSGAATGTASSYEDAAKKISDVDYTKDGDELNKEIPATCDSLAGQFLHFYYGDPDLYRGNYMKDTTEKGCPVTLGKLLKDYFASNNPKYSYSSTHYIMNYSYFPGNFTKPDGSFTAYVPGPFNGVGPMGKWVSPFGNGQSENMKRNFYSTKFIALDSLREDGGYNEANRIPIYSEGAHNINYGLNRAQGEFKNPLVPEEINADLREIKH